MLFLGSSEIGRNEYTATVVAMYSGMRLEEICNIQDKHVFEGCFHVDEGKTEAAARVIPVHPLIKPLLEPMRGTFGKGYLIDGI